MREREGYLRVWEERRRDIYGKEEDKGRLLEIKSGELRRNIWQRKRKVEREKIRKSVFRKRVRKA